jgi:hypothetical protein
VTSSLCAATFSNSYVKWRLCYAMIRFVAAPIIYLYWRWNVFMPVSGPGRVTTTATKEERQASHFINKQLLATPCHGMWPYVHIVCTMTIIRRSNETENPNKNTWTKIFIFEHIEEILFWRGLFLITGIILYNGHISRLISIHNNYYVWRLPVISTFIQAILANPKIPALSPVSK